LGVRDLAARVCLLATLPAALVACGDDHRGEGGNASTSTGSSTLTVYSSLPLQGDTRPVSEAIMEGEKLALSKAGGRIGRFTVKYRALDDAKVDTEIWHPGATAANARTAAQDKSTVAYLGELNSDASAVSIPVLNEAGILQVSPGSTAVGLTRSEGAQRGEPDKYYPSGKRNFARIVPNDLVQAAAQVTMQKDAGCLRLYVLDDRSVYGIGLAGLVAAEAKKRGLTVGGRDSIDPQAANYRDLAAAVSADGADCIVFAGSSSSNAVRLWRDLHAASRRAKLFGSDGVAVPAFAKSIGASAAKVTYVTSPALARRFLPPAGQRLFAEYRASHHGRDPDPGFIYGYEAMSVVLRAIRNARDDGNDRQAITQALFAIRNRPSVLGRYSFDKNGDTSLKAYGGYRVRGGRLVFDRVIKPARS
jgi:branched-chain amino acid transport system substrate-binding protein